MNKSVLILIGLFFIALIANGQNSTPRFIAPSPDTYSLAKYGDIPISYYTGTPNINIPLCTLVDGDVSLPISLSYHASGLKVDEIASLVGLGWSLNAGGMITRIIKEEPDAPSLAGISLNAPRVDNSFNWFNDFMKDENLILRKEEYISYLEQIYGQNGWYDDEPDVFYYNFNGKSGKFYFDNNAMPCLYKHDNVKIKWQRTGATINDVKFIVIDEYGNSYEFEDKETTLFEGIGQRVTTWYLSKIISQKGFVISFTYQSHSIVNHERLPRIAVLDARSGSANLISYSNIIIQGLPKIELKLTQITTSSGGSVSFIADTQNARLDYPSSYPTYPLKEIIIKNATNVVERIFTLNTGYFVTNNQNSLYPHLNYRLKLNNVWEYSGDRSQSKLLCNFSYFGDSPSESLLRLPYRLSPSQDHWGYYNGQPNVHLFPGKNSGIGVYEDNVYALRMGGGSNSFSGPIINGANREPDVLLKKACSLKEIIYPTGGYTIFDYESHTNNGDNVAGLRIKAITNFDETNSSVVTYSYEGCCLPFLFDTRYYFTLFYVDQDIFNGNDYGSNLVNSLFGFSLDNTFDTDYVGTGNYIKVAVNPQAVLDGAESGLGYGKITESRINNGYTIFTYANAGDFVSLEADFVGGGSSVPLMDDWFQVQAFRHCDNYYNCTRVVSPNKCTSYDTWPVECSLETYSTKDWPNLPFYSNEWKRSVLKSKEVYLEDASTPVYSETYEYNMENLGNIAGYCMNRVFLGTTGTDQYEYFIAKYYIPFNWVALKSTHIIDSGVEKTIKYNYNTDSYRLLKKTLIYDSKGDSIELLYKYPSDINVGIYHSMKDSNIINIPIEQTTKVDGKWTASKLTTYKTDNGNYVPDKVYAVKTTTPLTSFTDYNGSLPDVNYGDSPEVEFLDYDAKGNLRKSRGINGIHSNYLWAYNSQYPVAKIESSTNTTISVSVDDNNLSKSDDFNAIRNDVLYLKGLLAGYINNDDYMVTLYTYNPLVGMTSQTDPNGVTTYYEYDSFGRLKCAKNDDGDILQWYDYHYAGQN